MAFVVLIPARLASTRLPRKALADIGGLPMVVRVARRAALSSARRIVVATDDSEILAACEKAGIEGVMTNAAHRSGSDRLAEACTRLELDDGEIVVNVQGDEPLIDPALIDACAATLRDHDDCAMSTAAHAIVDAGDFVDPNVVKVVVDGRSRALYFSRAPIPWLRDATSATEGGAGRLRHVGLYAYRVGFLKRFPSLPRSPLEDVESLEQLRVLWHGERIAVHVAESAAGIGIDTPEDLARVRALVATTAGAGFA